MLTQCTRAGKSQHREQTARDEIYVRLTESGGRTMNASGGGFMPIVLAERTSDSGRAHTDQLDKLLRSTAGQVRIASPYVTETGIIQQLAKRKTRLLTSLSPMDVVSGATRLDALSA